ncbi:hypothetical protein MAPG_10660 [Magnaporthiopsis poae ATCC 64411]|uniref:DUF7580 domain-containing protein n=1 Tax=Magnaporthiopsis poae (strain ATCC 64411 / 73-15) TaxID=644358 RepID=A0A0C4ED67_MAGP6|nr:hypothetical protein MAPG_10660 [Magnaporthiopsis poae ATCC 64411]
MSHSSANNGSPEWERLASLRSFRGRLINSTEYQPIPTLGGSGKHTDQDGVQLYLSFFEETLRELFWKNEVCFLDQAGSALTAESKGHLRSICALLNRLVNVELLEEQDRKQHVESVDGAAGEYRSLDALLSVLRTSNWPFQLATGDSGRTLFHTASVELAEEANTTVSVVDGYFSGLCQPFLKDISLRPVGSPAESDDLEVHSMQGAGTQDPAGQALDELLRIVHKIEQGFCKKGGHQVLVQLIDSDTDPGSGEPELNLFLSTCHDPDTKPNARNYWQEAQLRVREKAETVLSDWEKVETICDELKQSYGGKGLRLTIHDGTVFVFVTSKIFHRPKACFRSRWPTITLSEKLKELAFVESPRDPRPQEGLFAPKEKRSLAARLVLSLGRSLDTERAVMAWDSSQVFFLSEGDGRTCHKDLSFVACQPIDRSTSPSDTDGSLDEQWGDSQRDTPFQCLAKLLLEIEWGYSYRHIVPDGDDEASFRKRLACLCE